MRMTMPMPSEVIDQSCSIVTLTILTSQVFPKKPPGAAMLRTSKLLIMMTTVILTSQVPDRWQTAMFGMAEELDAAYNDALGLATVISTSHR